MKGEVLRISMSSMSSMSGWLSVCLDQVGQATADDVIARYGVAVTNARE